MNNNQTVLEEFIKAINLHDVDQMLGFTTTDHQLVDSLGNIIENHDTLQKAWKEYFEWFPDYNITVEELIATDTVCSVFGSASATYMRKETFKEYNHWILPCAWKAVLENGKIKTWQVFGDTKMVADIIERNRVSAGFLKPKK